MLTLNEMSGNNSNGAGGNQNENGQEGQADLSPCFIERSSPSFSRHHQFAAAETSGIPSPMIGMEPNIMAVEDVSLAPADEQ